MESLAEVEATFAEIYVRLVEIETELASLEKEWEDGTTSTI